MMVKLKLNFQKTLLFALRVTMHIHLIISTIYSSFENHLDYPSYFEDKAILVPINEEVDAINDYMLELMKHEWKMYMSLDSLCETEAQDSFEESVYPPDVLNGFKASGILNHKLTLKNVLWSCYFVISTKPKDYIMVLDYRL